MCERSRSVTFSVLWLIFHIFGPRKDKTCCSVFNFDRDIYSFCKKAWMYHWYMMVGTIPFQYICNSCNARFYSFRNRKQIYFSKMNRAYVRARCGPGQRRMHFFVLLEACILDFYWVVGTATCNRNQNEFELKHCRVISSILMLNICFVNKEI